MIAAGRADLAANAPGGTSTGPQPPVAPPQKMHFCAVFCNTFVLDHGRYVAESNRELPPECGITIQRFTRESVIMIRTDCAPYVGKAVLTGTISGDGNEIIDGTIKWLYHPCCGGIGSGPFHAAWGKAIDSIPGSGIAPAVYARASTVPPHASVPPIDTSQAPPPPTLVPAGATEGLTLDALIERVAFIDRNAVSSLRDIRDLLSAGTGRSLEAARAHLAMKLAHESYPDTAATSQCRAGIQSALDAIDTLRATRDSANSEPTTKSAAGQAAIQKLEQLAGMELTYGSETLAYRYADIQPARAAEQRREFADILDSIRAIGGDSLIAKLRDDQAAFLGRTPDMPPHAMYRIYLGYEWLAAVERIAANPGAGASVTHLTPLGQSLDHTDASPGELSVAVVPLQMQECELNVNQQQRCASWAWKQGYYEAIFDDDTEMKVAVDRWTKDAVLFHMLPEGQPQGLAVTFTGHPQGYNGLAGESTVTWPGHWPQSPFGAGVSKTRWSANIQLRGRPGDKRCQSDGSAPTEVAAALQLAAAAVEAGDLVAGACWTRVAALRGNAAAESILANLLLRGVGVPRNYTQAFDWTLKAANQGLNDAQLQASYMYEDAIGVKRDGAKADYWREQSELNDRRDFAAVLSRSQPDNEATQLQAIGACEGNPAMAMVFAAECARPFHQHIAMLRSDNNMDDAVEACREEEDLNKQVSYYCAGVAVDAGMKADMDAAKAARAEYCRKVGGPECTNEP